MRREQGPGSRGSQKWLQILINKHRNLLNQKLCREIGVSPEEIHWLSPLEEDGYAEYNDADFIERLGITLDKVPLYSFWPEGGPWWDGLGKTGGGKILLVEAKAHIPELDCSAPRILDTRLSEVRCPGGGALDVTTTEVFC